MVGGHQNKWKQIENFESSQENKRVNIGNVTENIIHFLQLNFIAKQFYEYSFCTKLLIL